MSKDALFSFCAVSCLKAKPCVVSATLVTFVICISCVTISLKAADYQTPNFIIRNAPDHGMARQFGETAESLRKEMAILWLGKELPRWWAPCPVFVKVGNYSAGGETSMDFNHGEVYGWNMKIQGSAESILTAVLPHEITHMILASHFRRPSPRWFDEGAATFVENEKERENYRRLLYQYLKTGRGISFNSMFRMGDYPDDQMPLYAQGFALAEFLIMQRGHQQYVDFASAGMKTNNWPQAMKDFYGYESLSELQIKWVKWIETDCPDLNNISLNEEIFVSDTKRYIPSRDFLPMRQPMILASTAQPSSNVIQASWEASRQTQNLATQKMASRLQPEREPIRMTLQQVQQNQTLTANVASMTETRLPSYFTDNQSISGQPVSGQHNREMTQDRMDLNQLPYQSSRSLQPQLPREKDSQVIFEYKIR